jgi:hypothetical protein
VKTRIQQVAIESPSNSKTRRSGRNKFTRNCAVSRADYFTRSGPITLCSPRRWFMKR